MNLIFLDFDGVVNSTQEVYWRHRINKRSRLVKYFKQPISSLVYKITKPLHTWLEKRGIVKWFGWRNWINWYLWAFTDHCDFCPVACSNVQHILDEVPNSMIVVSSVWRSWGVEGCRKILARNGIDPKRVYAVLPSKGWGADITCRGDQIEWWLHNSVNPWPVERVVIIDDDSDMNRMMPYFVKTKTNEGLMWTQAIEAIKMLVPGKYEDR